MRMPPLKPITLENLKLIQKRHLSNHEFLLNRLMEILEIFFSAGKAFYVILFISLQVSVAFLNPAHFLFEFFFGLGSDDVDGSVYLILFMFTCDSLSII